jgi:hypothetical protein
MDASLGLRRAALVLGIAGCASAAPPAATSVSPIAAPPELCALRFLAPDDGANADALAREISAALRANLLGAGLGVTTEPSVSHDARLRVSLTMHSAGLVVEGVAVLMVERSGVLIAQITLPRDIYRRDRAAEAIARGLTEGLVRSTALMAFARNLGPPIAETPPPATPAAASVSPTPPPVVGAGPAPLGEAGAFARGINVEILGLGPVQAIGPGGEENGIGLAVAVQLDAGPRWAFRLPLSLDVTDAISPGGFADLSITPGLLHRWRTRSDQRWIPYAGGGIKLGSFEAGHSLLDLPLVTTSALFGDHHSFGGGHPHDPNRELRLRAAPEVWGGLEYHTSSWFSLNLTATYAWIRIAGENVHLFRELLAFRFSF